LLVDLNRSARHPNLFSGVTRRLSPDERDTLLARHYTPHRTVVESTVARLARPGALVAHLAIHSFTPRLGGVVRTADLGILYDPARPEERALCAELLRAIRSVDPMLVLRRNYPYRGSADGLTTALRRRFPDSRYTGIEIEMNQRFAEPRRRRRIERALVTALSAVLGRPIRR
jgi:predicted N-formylglutamate amidohydrolase